MKIKKIFASIVFIVFLLGYTIPAQASTTNPPATPPQPAVPATLATQDPSKGIKPSPIGPLEVSAAIYSDESKPVRDLYGLAPATFDNGGDNNEQLLPIEGKVGKHDGALQTSTGALVGTTSGLNFAGVGQGDYGYSVDVAPSDDNGAVGATQYVQWVNDSLAVYNKTTGAIVSGFPKLGNSLWVGFGGGCETNNDGDPIVQYDKIHNRWVLTQFSVATTPYLECVAVSTTSDATGSYYRYAFSYGNSQFNDYPKMSVWPDGYYISYNIFTSSFAGSKVCALQSAKMLVGDVSAIQQCFQLSSAYGGLLPSDLDGATLPPSGSPNFFMNFKSNALNLWKFHVDWVTTTNTTFTGPTSISVPSFSAACGGGGTCIPQGGVTQQLDSLADRLMYRLAYRNYGDHEALVVNQSVTAGSSVGVRWYEIRSPNGTPSVYQASTFAPDTNYRWMGSIAMDKVGDMAMGYSVSSASMKPSIRYTGRVPSDTLNTMEAETSILSGSGSQTGYNLSRWGDYTAMTIDPVDDCTFWYTDQYLKADGNWNWSTQIASFKFPACSNPPTVVSITRASTNPSSATSVDFNVIFSESVTGVNTGDFNITQSGLTGASVTNVSGSGAIYTVTASTGSGSANGTLRLDLTDDDGIKDTVGLPLGGAGNGNGNFNTGDVYTITRSANVNVTIAGALVGNYGVPKQTATHQNYPVVNNGPVTVINSNTLPLVASERIAYSPNSGATWTSYAELMGLPSSKLTDTYIFPWYNSLNLSEQVAFANVGSSSTTVTVTIGGVVQGSYLLTPSQSLRIKYPGLNTGPVKVQSTGSVPIVASERIAFSPDAGVTYTNYFELMGLPFSSLTDTYYYPWYNTVNFSAQVSFANVGASNTTVTVTIGNVLRGTYPLTPNQSMRIKYVGLNMGPVVVHSTGGVPIISSERVSYTPDAGVTYPSFSEVIGLPVAQLSNNNYFPWYNNVNHSMQFSFANVGTSSTTVSVTIGGVLQGSYPLTANQSTQVRYVGQNSGPVQISSSNGMPIISSENVIYTPDAGVTYTSFAEMMGLPGGQLSNSYVFPWYNSVNLNTEIRFGAP